MLKKFNTYLMEQNKLFNLTAIKDEQQSWILNIQDSLLFLDAIPQNANICDVGSGCGCPAIPIAIERPDIKMTMIDSVKKKVDFLNNFPLKNAKAIHTRIEDYVVIAREQGDRGNPPFDVVTARAVAPLNTLLEYCIPLLKTGGVLLAFKGTNYQQEIEQAQKAFKELNCKLETTLEKPLSDMMRYCLVIKKLTPTNPKYPRGKNLPRIKPL